MLQIKDNNRFQRTLLNQTKKYTQMLDIDWVANNCHGKSYKIFFTNASAS